MFNLEAYAERLYRYGHRPEDFAELAGDLVVVSPIRPPGIIAKSGLHAPSAATDIRGQFALTHKVEAAGPEARFNGQVLNVGDIVKCYEAHLDPLEPGMCNMLSIPAKHIKAVVCRAAERAKQGQAA